MKGQTWFRIKCDNVPKSQVMKEKSLNLRDNLLSEFKENLRKLMREKDNQI